jgi:D-lactate dehydrogenase (cytochrome)
MDIVVQPSVSWIDMNESIKESGLFFPIDPGPPVRAGAGFIVQQAETCFTG